MEKYALEIETPASWVNYHVILRPGDARAREVIAEIRETNPKAEFRLVRWTGEVVE